MYTSAIRGVEVPLLIPRRAKAYSEVLANFEVETKGIFDPVKFVKSFEDLHKSTFAADTRDAFDAESPLRLARSLQQGHRRAFVDLRIKFLLPIDRMSPTFVGTTIEAPCEYRAIASKSGAFMEMTLEMPAQVRDTYLQAATLTFTVKNPRKRLYFEDLWDHVQKYGEFVIFPLACVEDRAKLASMLNKGKKVRQLLTTLQDNSQKVNLGSEGRILIRFSDVYSMYNFSYSTTW